MREGPGLPREPRMSLELGHSLVSDWDQGRALACDVDSSLSCAVISPEKSMEARKVTMPPLPLTQLNAAL